MHVLRFNAGSCKGEIVKGTDIKDRIFTIRGKQVMLDSDLAQLYGVETKRLNEQVRRNKGRFPELFCFRLNEDEYINLKSQNATSSWGGRRTTPFVFTEHGVAMAATVLKSKVAEKVSVEIVKTFIQLRNILKNKFELFFKVGELEVKQQMNEKKFEILFKALESKQLQPKQGIFFEGQVFEAYKLVSDVVRSAKKSIVLIDNYVDDTVLTLFSKRKKGVTLKILTKIPDKKIVLDVKKFNEQFPPAEIIKFDCSHDRFMIIDGKDLYHFGASLKDLGKKWFAFSKMDVGIADMIRKVNKI